MISKKSIFSFLILLSACGENLSEYVKLDKLRIVSIVAKTPEVSPGATVTLTPWVADVQGGGRSLTFSAVGCVDPGIAQGAEISCDGLVDGLNESGTFALAGPSYVGVAPSLAVKIPSTVLKQKSFVDQVNGVPYIVIYKLILPSGEELKSIKRIWVTSPAKFPKNSNPALVDILKSDGGGTLVQLPGSATRLKADIVGSSVESYSTLTFEGKMESKTEEMITTWFYTDGKTDSYRSIGAGAVEWTPPSSAPSGRKVTVIAVTRDGRGGESVLMRSF